MIFVLSTTACILAFWPVWGWYVSRTLDHSDEPWGLLALISALTLIIWESRRAPKIERVSRHLPLPIQAAIIILLVGYVCTFTIAPNLVQSLLLVAISWLLLSSVVSMPSRAGIFGLLVLSLPIIPSLNFFAGYPMRYIVAAGAIGMLRCLGLAALQDGTTISVDGKLASIDAPCSGINMLWVNLYVAMLLASLFRLKSRSTIAVCAFSAITITAANILRATALVLFDHFEERFQALGPMEPIIHPLVGIAGFCATAAATYAIAVRLSRTTKSEMASEDYPDTVTHKSSSPVPDPYLQRFATPTLLIIAFVGAILPFSVRPGKTAMTPAVSPVWPSVINGRAITPVESLREERAFATDFPGEMKRFTDGKNAYFVRYVAHETRKLHPSSDCFRGLGYDIEPRALVVDGDNQRWGSFNAVKGEKRYLIMERIYDTHNQSWSDVSAWYWAACLNQSRGPWFAVTIAIPIDSAS